ncbi:MAG: hypothetical protein ACOZIN_02895 [Myxococcota bacterium]
MAARKSVKQGPAPATGARRARRETAAYQRELGRRVNEELKKAIAAQLRAARALRRELVRRNQKGARSE